MNPPVARGVRAAIALLAVAIGLLTACSPAEDEYDVPRERGGMPVELVWLDGMPAPDVLAENQVLRRGNGEEPQSLDPHRAEGVPAANILRDLFEGLTTEAADGEIIPGSASRWNISRDGMEYTFYLRRDGRWSNGDSLTAEDFVFSFRRAVNPATASNTASMLSPIVNAQQIIAGELPVDELAVEALDPFTLQIRLTAPTPYFLGLMAHSISYPVHRASVESLGDRFARDEDLVSNGAFMLQRWDPRRQVVLLRNPYFREAEKTLLERVIYLPTEDLGSEVKQFRAGELDWTYEVPSNQFAWLQEHYADELVITPWLGSYFFGFNLEREPFFENPKLRRALVLAIDRDVITDKVTQFGEQASYVLIPPGIGEYESPLPDYAGWSQEQRNEAARRLYTEAGYSAERPLQVEIRYNTSENHKKVALAIASMWKQVLGVNASLFNEEWKVFLQNRQQRDLTQVFRAGWISDYNDPYSFLELFKSGDGRNDYGYSNSSFDALLEEIARERAPARRQRMMREAERMLLEDNVIIPVYTYVTKRLVDPHIAGWQSNVMDHHYSRYLFRLRSQSAETAAPEALTIPGTAAEAEVSDQVEKG